MPEVRLEIGATVTSHGERWVLSFETIDGKWFARKENHPAITTTLDPDEIEGEE